MTQPLDGDIQLAKPSDLFDEKKMEDFMGKYQKLAEDIVTFVGGKDNISGLTHCVTRLRFQLKNQEKAEDDVLKQMEGVVTVMKSGGQYQVVIGSHVPKVYIDVCEVAGLSTDGGGEAEVSGAFNKLIDVISGCFQPFLGVLCATGMIKGLNALLLFLGVYTPADGAYLMLDSIGGALFYFLPVIVGYTSAKKFKLSPFLGMVIGAALCYPAIQLGALSAGADPLMVLFQGTAIEAPVYTTLFGIPFLAQNYTSSVIPSIVIVWFASKVQKVVQKFVPELIQNFFVPFFILLISLPIGLLVIGPAASIASNLVGTAFSSLYSMSPIICGALLGFFWQVLVIFGLHWGVIPIGILNLGLYQFDVILPLTFAASFAQTAVVAAMYFKLKDQKIKSLCFPAVISGVCGVTEPAIYGITLPKKAPFIYSMIGAGIGGAILGWFSVKSYTNGGLGIFGFVSFINPATNDSNGVIGAFVSVVVASVIGFLLVLFFWKDGESKPTGQETGSAPVKSLEKERAPHPFKISSPIQGKIIPLSDVKDAAFTQGVLGRGVAIEPVIGQVVAPFDAVVSSLFPTNHAIGLTSTQGIQMLIHVGMDTVQLEGKYFTPEVAEGDAVKKGEVLLTFDLEQMKAEGYCLQTPVLITNAEEYLDVVEFQEEVVSQDDTLLTIFH